MFKYGKLWAVNLYICICIQLVIYLVWVPYICILFHITNQIFNLIYFLIN